MAEYSFVSRLLAATKAIWGACIVAQQHGCAEIAQHRKCLIKPHVACGYGVENLHGHDRSASV